MYPVLYYCVQQKYDSYGTLRDSLPDHKEMIAELQNSQLTEFREHSTEVERAYQQDSFDRIGRWGGGEILKY